MCEKVLSVSIAAYNVESTLREALEPFTAPEIRELVDVMIVNDGSTDKTSQIAAEYQQKYPGTFRLITKENGGWGSTLNVGIKAAKGKYFKQLDGDDYYSRENLYDFLTFLSGLETDYVYSPFVTFENESGGVIKVVGQYYGEYRFFPLNKAINIGECDTLELAMHCTTIKTSVLQENNIHILEHCFYTDVEFVLKSYSFCKTIAFFEKPIYYYRLARDGQSMSISGIKKHYKEHQRMLITMLEYYEKAELDMQVRDVFQKRLDGACNMQYNFYFALQCNRQQKKDLQEFDKFLLINYPEFYYRVKSKRIVLLRKTNFLGYKILSKHKMIKDKQNKKGIFEGC